MKFRIQRQWRWLVALGAVFVPGIVSGALELPFTFKAGNAIKASEVNANFEALRAKLDALSSGAAPIDVGTLTLEGVLSDAPIHKFTQSIDVPFNLGGTSGKPKLSEIVVERDSSDGTPDVNLQLCQATVAQTADIVLGNLTIHLTNVSVVNVAVAAPRAGRPQEAISLLFSGIKWTYTAKGQPTRVVDYNSKAGLNGGAAAQDFLYGYFPPGVAADATYVPIYAATQQIGCVTPAVACRPAHSLLSVQKDSDADTLYTLALALSAKAGSTVEVDWLNDAGAVNNSVQLDDVLVASVNLSTNPEGALLETAGFGYGRISWTSGNATRGWDVAKGLPL